MTSLLDALAADLERPREVPPQVIKHLGGVHNVTRDNISAFLANELTGLEEYEIDLIFSPIFTPTIHDQAVSAALLGQGSVPAQQWPGLIAQLVARPTHAHLIASKGASAATPVLLREVTIERYVNRLRLDATIPDPLFKLITHLAPESDRPVLLAVARRAVWENAARREILQAYLTTAISRDDYRLADVLDLLKLAEIYQPAGISDLLARIPQWQQILRQEIKDGSGPRPFLNERIEEMHGGGRDQRREDGPAMAARRNEQAFLQRLQQVMAAPA